jgi:riboflavin biosynthesis pyrimidine reductase
LHVGDLRIHRHQICLAQKPDKVAQYAAYSNLGEDEIKVGGGPQPSKHHFGANLLDSALLFLG